MVYFIQFTDQELLEYRDKLNWKGDGTEENPIVIESIEGIKQYLRFKNITKYLIINDIEICEFYVISCRNISIENCRVYFLTIEYSRNIKVENSSIAHFDSRVSRGNFFRNNLLHEDSGWSRNTMDTMGEGKDVMTSFYKTCFLLLLMILVPSFVIVVIMAILSGETISISDSIWMIFIVLISLPLVILIFMLNLNVKKKIMQKLPPNVFENNQFANLDELDKKYSEIYDI